MAPLRILPLRLPRLHRTAWEDPPGTPAAPPPDPRDPVVGTRRHPCPRPRQAPLLLLHQGAPRIQRRGVSGLARVLPLVGTAVVVVAAVVGIAVGNNLR